MSGDEGLGEGLGEGFRAKTLLAPASDTKNRFILKVKVSINN